MILFLFLSHLALGIIFTLVFVSREAGVKFFRFNAGLASILLVIAIGFSQSLGVDPFSRWALVTSAGAIANAIYDAIRVRVTELPVTPERIFTALQRCKEGREQ